MKGENMKEQHKTRKDFGRLARFHGCLAIGAIDMANEGLSYSLLSEIRREARLAARAGIRAIACPCGQCIDCGPECFCRMRTR